MEAVGLALAGADVYGFHPSAAQVEAVKDLARRMGLRDRTHLQISDREILAYPNNFFDLVLGKTLREDGDRESQSREVARVMRRGGRGAFLVPADDVLGNPLRTVFGAAVLGQGWIGVEKRAGRTTRATGRI